MNDQHASFPLIALISWASSILPVIVGWTRRKYLSRGDQIFLGLLTFYLPVLLVQLVMVFSRINSMWTSQVYTLIEFIAIAAVYYVDTDKSIIRFAIKWAMFVFCAFWLIAKLTFEPITLYDNFTSPVAAVLLIVPAGYKLLELSKDSSEPMFKKSMYWISVGIIVYCVGTMPIFSLANMLLKKPLEDFANVWQINWGLTILANVIYTKAFACKL